MRHNQILHWQSRWHFLGTLVNSLIDLCEKHLPEDDTEYKMSVERPEVWKTIERVMNFPRPKSNL